MSLVNLFMRWLSYITPLEIIKFHSPLNGEIKVIESFGKRKILVNNAEQSGGTITGMWDRALKIKNYLPRRQTGKLPARNAMQSVAGGQITNCLILGLGGGTVINLLNKYYPEADITAIEIDPVMIDIYKKYFEHNSPGVNIIQADAFSWIKKSKMKFDLIIFDLYLGKFNPKKARTSSFLKDLKRLLNISGFILFNSHYQNDEEEFQKFFRLCKKVFSQAELILRYPYSRILELR